MGRMRCTMFLLMWHVNVPPVPTHLFQQTPLGWRNAKQVAHEEVHALMVAESFAHSVAGARHDHELEVLACLLECCSHLHGGGGIDIVVQFSYDEH